MECACFTGSGIALSTISIPNKITSSCSVSFSPSNPLLPKWIPPGLSLSLSPPPPLWHYSFFFLVTFELLRTRSADKGNLGVPQLPGQGCSFHSFRTNTYKLSFMETPSGIKVCVFFLFFFK